MAERPRGTVTFLFTDLEGSTRLLKQLRDRYGEVLGEHQRILREAFTAHGGDEVDTQGDAFFYVFSRARHAADAAAAAQRALAAHSWPEGLEFRVRIGMHTAEPTVSNEGRYHGLGVHRTARIMAAGHGGQILVSRATASVLEDDEPPGIRLRELGEHRLKDLDRPERIYQLDVEGLPKEFPPLRTADAPRAAVWRAEFWTRRRLVVAGAGALAAAAVAGVLTLVLGGTAQALSHIDANALGLINAKTNRIADQVSVGATPSHVAVGEGVVWVTNADDHSVSRIDPLKRTVVQTIAVGSGPSGIAVGNGAVWVANSLDGTVSRIDPGTNTVVQTVGVGNGPVGVAFGTRSVWVANTDDSTIAKINVVSGKVMQTIDVGANELTFGGRALWATNTSGNSVSRIDPVGGSVVQRIAVGNGPSGIAFGAGSIWVANDLDGTVSRIDPRKNTVAATIPVGDGPSGIAVGAGGIWVSNEFGGTVARIDPRTNRVTQRIEVGNRPKGVAVVNGRVLVGVRASGAGHRGGTLTMRTDRFVDSIDTSVAYDTLSWSLLSMTGDGLTGFKRAGGSEGTQLVPDLAVSLPAPTDEGRTYSFQLRPNIRYSTGRPLKASDIRYAIERDVRIGSPGIGFYQGIVGGVACMKTPRRCDLSKGIVADDAAGTVTFHLAAPDPDLLYKLALPFAYVVPAGTPPRDVGTHPLPAMGPYAIKTYKPKRMLELVRNKYFHEWSKAAQPAGYPDEIVLKSGGTADESVAAVERGRADAFSGFQSGPPSAGRLTEIKTRYASRVHTNPQTATIGLFLNTRVHPFDRLEARRAINYAVDRNVAVKIEGGTDLAQPTCQILPPNFPGYRSYCPYTAGGSARGEWTAPDLAKARRLIDESGTRGTKVTVWAYSPFKDLGPYTARLLRSLGYRASVKVLAGSYFPTVENSRTKAQIGFLYWGADYPAASDFLSILLSCGAFRAGSPSNQSLSEFCDPSIDREIKRALNVQAASPQAASLLWARIDRRVVDQAPWVPLFTPKLVDFLSKRVGNYQYSPVWGMLIDQLWVR